jgi:hypothetical protein
MRTRQEGGVPTLRSAPPGRRTLVGAAACAILSLAAGCTDPLGTVCTMQFVYGVTVTVLDGGSGEPIATGATLTIRESGYMEVVTDSFDGRSLAGAGERAGRYTLTVERPGYAPWVQDGVVVLGGECHVTPVSLEARLTSL